MTISMTMANRQDPPKICLPVKKRRPPQEHGQGSPYCEYIRSPESLSSIDLPINSPLSVDSASNLEKFFQGQELGSPAWGPPDWTKQLEHGDKNEDSTSKMELHKDSPRTFSDPLTGSTSPSAYTTYKAKEDRSLDTDVTNLWNMSSYPCPYTPLGQYSGLPDHTTGFHDSLFLASYSSETSSMRSIGSSISGEGQLPCWTKQDKFSAISQADHSHPPALSATQTASSQHMIRPPPDQNTARTLPSNMDHEDSYYRKKPVFTDMDQIGVKAETPSLGILNKMGYGQNFSSEIPIDLSVVHHCLKDPLQVTNSIMKSGVMGDHDVLGVGGAHLLPHHPAESNSRGELPASMGSTKQPQCHQADIQGQHLSQGHAPFGHGTGEIHSTQVPYSGAESGGRDSGDSQAIRDSQASSSVVSGSQYSNRFMSMKCHAQRSPAYSCQSMHSTTSNVSSASPQGCERDYTLEMDSNDKVAMPTSTSGRSVSVLQKAAVGCPPCSVCGDVSSGFHCGAYVCEACKKFFLRCVQKNNVKFTCSKKQDCQVTKESRTQCQHCRYQRCIQVGMYKPGSGLGPSLDADISEIPCKVCGAPSSGYHFGAITCEGCKGFFRRTVKERDCLKYGCSREGKCVITMATRNLCKFCRYKKCQEVGMTPKGSRIGRQPNAVKYHTLLELQELAESKKVNLKTEVEEVSDIAQPLDLAESREFEEFRADVIDAKKELEPLKQRSSELENVPDGASEEQIWTAMMKSFTTVARCVVKFAKKIPGFQGLNNDDKAVMIQASVYQIILTVHALDYDMANRQYNYFHFTKEEEVYMLKIFPQFKVLQSHFHNIGYAIKSLAMDNTELSLFLAAIILSPDENMLKAKDLAGALLERIIMALQYYCDGKNMEFNRHGCILLRLAELQKCNIQHHHAVLRLRSDKPYLTMPQLWREMFFEQ